MKTVARDDTFPTQVTCKQLIGHQGREHEQEQGLTLVVFVKKGSVREGIVNYFHGREAGLFKTKLGESYSIVVA